MRSCRDHAHVTRCIDTLLRLHAQLLTTAGGTCESRDRSRRGSQRAPPAYLAFARVRVAYRRGQCSCFLQEGSRTCVRKLAGVSPLLSRSPRRPWRSWRSMPGARQAAASDPYTWKNVRIDGGGFVPGIIFNQTEQNLIYARTDIGGAYRWDQATSKWIPLLDWVGWSNWGWNGVVSLATDPVQTNKVYAAAGMYTNGWDPNNGAILRSSDKGATWQTTALPFKLGGNMPGRGMGERLAVDPNRNSILYFGAPSGNGLWRSTDSGVTWAKVTDFPNPGNYIQQRRATPYLGDNQGVVWVSFDKSTGTAGQRHPGHLRRRGRQGTTRSTAAPTAAPPGSASPGSRPATSPTRASSTRSTTSSTSPPATPAARTTAARATCGSTTSPPVRGPRSARSRPAAPTTTSATAA